MSDEAHVGAPSAKVGTFAGEPSSASPPPAVPSSYTTPLDNDAAPGTAASLKRKRTTGTRGVANLTPEQLERKRANDREAQRAIRERTKTHIERLNAEIRELKSQQPYHDLQLAIRRKDAILAENEELRLRIKSFVQGIRPFMGGMLDGLGTGQQTGPGAGGMGLDDLAAAAANTMQSHTPEAGPSTAMHQAHNTPYQAQPMPDGASPSLSLHAPSPMSSHSAGPSTSYRYHPVPAANRSWTTSDPSYEHSPRDTNIHPDLGGAGVYNQSDERLGLGYLLHGSQQEHNGRISNGASPLPNPTTVPHGVYPTWSTLPRNTEPSCPLDGLLLNFLHERRRLAETGVHSSELTGPAYPNFNALLNPNTNHYNHPLSKVMTDLLRTFPDIRNLPEQVAICYIMFLVMRWELDPTRANYERLPSWMTPRASQLFNAHPIWLDYLPFPLLRDATIHAQPQIPFNDFFIPFTTTISLNWPYDPASVLLSVRDQQPPPHPPTHGAAAATAAAAQPPPADEPVYAINPAFEAHLRKLENWTLGPAFAEEFPHWRSSVQIKERDGSIS